MRAEKTTLSSEEVLTRFVLRVGCALLSISFIGFQLTLPFLHRDEVRQADEIPIFRLIDSMSMECGGYEGRERRYAELAQRLTEHVSASEATTTSFLTRVLLRIDSTVGDRYRVCR